MPAPAASDLPAVPCLLCGDPTVLVISHVRDNRLGVEGSWDIRRCQACGIEQTDPLPSEDELEQLYARHYNGGGEDETTYGRWRERLLMSRLYRAFLLLHGDAAFHRETGSGRLLDVGCNEGRGLAIYQRNGFTVEGLEPNSRAAHTTRRRGFTVHTVRLEEFRPAMPFDRLVLANVLEHARSPRAMLVEARRLLRPGGEIWISLPNAESWLRRVFGRSWINWHVPFHVTHNAAACLRALLEREGFTVIAERQVTPLLWFAQSFLAWASRGRSGLLHHPLLLPATMALCGSLLPWLRLADARGHGDCLLIKARAERNPR